MRNDQLEQIAGEIAAAVARAVLAASGKLDLITANLLSAVAAQAARDAAWRVISRATAVRIEADTASVVDLRTR